MQDVMRRTEDDAVSKIEALAARHRPGDVRISTRVAEGRAKVEILRMIDEMHADLVVMGTHGRSGLSHVLLGSVAERVVRTSPVPVMTVRLAPPT
jgi:nucleotide-binding universal stress UspA family protein